MCKRAIEYPLCYIAAMQFNRVLRNTLIFGIFLVPLIPLVVMNEWYFPFITGKNFFFRILVELLFALWILLAIRDMRYRPSFSWLLVTVGAFLIVIGFADLLGENPFKSFWSNFERMEGFLALTHLCIYFVIAGTVLQTQRLWGWFAHTSVGVSIVLGIYALLQLAGIAQTHGSNRVDATLGNATYMAVYMLFHVFITAVLLYKWRGGIWARFLYGAIIILQLIPLYYTATRGAILGLVGGVLLSALIFAVLRWRNTAVRYTAIGIVTVLIVSIGGFIAVKDADFVQESSVLSRFANISLEQGTVQSRFTIWRMALAGVQERPIFGWGQENFNFIFNKYYDPKLAGQEPWFDRAHNVFFDWLTAGGILGLITYLAIALFALLYLWRRESAFSDFEKSAFTGLFAAYGFHNLFVFDNIVSYILYFSVLAYLYARVREQVRPGTLMGAQINTGMATRVVAPLLIVAVIASVYFFNIRAMTVAGTIIDGLRAHAAGQHEETLTHFNNAVAYKTTGRQEAREQFIQVANRSAGQSIDTGVKQKYFDGARNAIEDLIDAVPNDARIRLFYGTLFSAYGLNDRAVAQYQKSIELSPNKVQLMIILGKNYINQQEYQKALEITERAYKLNTNYDDTAIMYAIAARFAGRPQLADQILMDHFGTHAINDDDLLQTYVRLGLFDRVIPILRERIAADGQSRDEQLQEYINLTSVYLEIGNISQAIATLREAIEKHPSFKEQGEQFIRDIETGRLP